MALDSSIILGGKQPEAISPIQTVGGLMQLRGQMADIALRQQQVEASKAQAAEHVAMQAKVQQETRNAQRQFEMKQKLTGLLQEPGFHSKLKQGDFTGLAANGIDMDIAGPLVDQLQKGWKAASDLDADKAKFHETGRSRFGDLLRDAETLEQMQEGLRILGTDHPELVQQVGAVPGGAQFTEWKKGQAASNGMARAILKAGLEDKETAAKLSKAETEAAQAGRVLAGTSELGVTEAQRLENEAKKTTAAEQKRRDDETYRHNLQTERAAFMNASKEAKPKAVPATVIKGLAANTQMLSTIDEALAALDPRKGGDPSAVGVKGLLPDTILNRVDPKGTNARALLARLAAQEFHDFSGAAVTPSEAARLKPFLPSVNDDVDTVRTKLAAMKKQIQGLNEAQREAYAEGFQALPGDKAAAKPAAGVPAVGSIEEGHRFKGGNPADPKNWEKVN